MLFGVIIADELEFIPVSKYAEIQADYACGTHFGNAFVSFKNNYGDTVKAVWCGTGKVNASTAAAFLIAEGASAIFNIGLSGSVSKQQIDGFVIGSYSFEADFDLTVLGYKEFAKPNQIYIYKTDEVILKAATDSIPYAVVGGLACGDLFLTDAKRGEYLNSEYGVSAFDMESGAIASVCYKSGVPFLSIRQISDGADDNATKSYTESNSQSKPDLLKVLISCMNKYSEVITRK